MQVGYIINKVVISVLYNAVGEYGSHIGISREFHGNVLGGLLTGGFGAHGLGGQICYCLLFNH